MNLELLLDFHKDAERQGPGSAATTRQALAFIPQPGSNEPEILDVGCGTGAQTTTLAQNTQGRITAVDLFPAFLEELEARARRLGLENRIKTEAYSMDQLPYEAERFDLIWSEGAVYNMGYEAGVRAWRKFLKPGGYLAVSELSWFTEERPKELEEHWLREYPGIDMISNKVKVLEKHGYSPVAAFQLPAACWMEEYYGPMLERMPAFLDRHGHGEEAVALVENERREIVFYEKYQRFYGYAFYIGRKLA